MSAATEHIRIPKAATSEAKFFVIDSMEALHKEDKLLSGEICRWLLDVIKITLPCVAFFKYGTAYKVDFHAQ